MKPKYKKGDVFLDNDEFKEYKVVFVNESSDGVTSYRVQRTEVKLFLEHELDKFELLKEADQ